MRFARAPIRRVLQRAALHVQSAGKEQISGRDILIAMFREPGSHAVHLLEAQGINRLDVVSYVAHGVSKIPSEDAIEPASVEGVESEEGGERRTNPLEAYTSNLNERAAAGDIDPLIGRDHEIERSIHVLCRRRTHPADHQQGNRDACRDALSNHCDTPEEIDRRAFCPGCAETANAATA